MLRISFFIGDFCIRSTKPAVPRMIKEKDLRRDKKKKALKGDKREGFGGDS